MALHTQLNNKGIYCIINNQNKKVYVGMTKASFLIRWAFHTKNLLDGVHTNKELQQDFIRYGAEAFSFYVLEVMFDETAIDAREMEWIKTLSGEFRLYNVKGNEAKSYFRRRKR